MSIASRSYRRFCGILLAVGILAHSATPASAEDAYPPGWNARNQFVGPILYDFRPGCWDDYKRYWPDDKRCMVDVPSRQISFGAAGNVLEARGNRLRSAEPPGPIFSRPPANTGEIR